MRSLLAFAAFTALAGAQPVAAQGEKVSSVVELAQKAESLKPGQWVWAPEISPEGPVVVYVDLTRQIADIYRNGVRIGVSTVSTGKPGHETPTGVFAILQKDRNHHSSTYNNAPMPFQQRLTWDGVALHAGGLPGYPESHGCVHLPYKFAEQLFGSTSMGGTVIVQGRAGAPIKYPAGGVLSPATASGLPESYRPLAADETFRWDDEAAEPGPLSVVISTSDNKMVVMRSGVEIARSRVELDGAPSETIVATLSFDPDGKPHWSMVPLPGHHDASGHPIDPSALNRLRIPHGMITRLRAAMTAGTHVLLTHASVDANTTAVPLTVMAAND